MILDPGEFVLGIKKCSQVETQAEVFGTLVLLVFWYFGL